MAEKVKFFAVHQTYAFPAKILSVNLTIF